MIVGVDFGAPKWARDQRRKIIAIAAHATAGRSYRIDATGMNARLLANDPPGWSAKELLDELLARPARVVGFDFPFCVPHALLRDERFASDVSYKDGAFLGWRSFNGFVAQRLPLTDPLEFAPFAAWRGDGEVIEVYPGATLRAMGLASYKSRPDEAVRLSIAACAAAGIKLDVDLRLIALSSRYSSGTAKAPDYDVADAFVALCTAILYAEGACRPVLAPDPVWQEHLLKDREGAIWVPTITTSAPV